jgi:NNP family nitrate/nitrite transporter-like MFS transporter
MSAIIGYIQHKHWGKAISIHEIGYNSSFIFSTLFTAVLLHIFSWRNIITLIGIFSIIMGILFVLFGKGGRFPGNPPNFKNLRRIITNRSFWIFVILFSLSAGASLGVFSILPTYLVSEHGMNYRMVNMTISISRAASLPFIFIAGYLFDIMNFQLLFGSIIFLTGILTIFLGLTQNDLLIFMIFLQPMIITCFFPIALAFFAKIVPKDLYNVAISVMIPISYFFGGGLVPLLLGLMGEYHSFASGIVIFGSTILGSTFLIFSISPSTVSEEPVHQ